MSQYTKYKLYVKQQRISGSSDSWVNCVPTEYSYDGDGTMTPVIVESASTDCGFTPPIEPIYKWVNMNINTDYYCDVCPQYLTFVALEDGTFKFKGTSANTQIQYSLDNGSTWNTLASNTNSPTVNAGNKIMWKAELTPTSNGIGTFSSTGRFDVEGNPTSLLFGDNFRGKTSLSGYDYAFRNLFNCCTKLISSENLTLTANELTTQCYYKMFYGCFSLTNAPSSIGDSTTIMAVSACSNMFDNCTALTNAPELPATTLAESCYNEMFSFCTSLTTAPSVLPATTLADYCYGGMFQSCRALTSAPQLPATTLANGCYGGMFSDCTSLTTAPSVLPATTLADYCYLLMFEGCTSLTSAPELPATTLTEQCYLAMFYNCTSLTSAPELRAPTLVFACYSEMFVGCTSLSNITCLATDISAEWCTDSWVQGVASSGTFTKASSMNNWPSGTSGIPTNWTVQNYQS